MSVSPESQVPNQDSTESPEVAQAASVETPAAEVTLTELASAQPEEAAHPAEVAQPAAEQPAAEAEQVLLGENEPEPERELPAGALLGETSPVAVPEVDATQQVGGEFLLGEDAPEPPRAEPAPGTLLGEAGPVEHAAETSVPLPSGEATPVVEEVAAAETSAETEAAALVGETADEAPAPKASGPVPTPGKLSPAVLAGRKPAAIVIPAAAPAADPTESMKFGRVDENGTVFVTTDEGEREVGTRPEGTPEEALAHFARRYDEVFAQATLVRTRLETTEVPAGEAAENLKRLRQSTKDGQLVGDLKALDETITAIAAIVSDKSRKEQAEREAARAVAREEREKVVAEAEQIAAQPPARTQWKNSGARMRELLDEWKRQQKEGVRLDKESENALWSRFSAARNGFDRARRAWFAELDQQHASAKAAKEDLVARAEALSTSTDWRSTPGEYRRLMDEWRAAGRASRADDDRLWERFRAAQQKFFDAKDEVVAQENVEFQGNLEVKEQLLTEAEALLPVQDLEATKTRLRDIQDRWEKAGKVPRADMGRVEGRLKAVEQAVRDAEDKKWKRTNPELKARASSMVEQLEVLVAKCQQDLAKAQAAGDTRKIAEAEKSLAARQAWLEQARGGLDDSEG